MTTPRTIREGQKFANRSGTKKLEVISIKRNDDGSVKSFIVARENGTTVTATAGKLAQAKELIESNGRYALQAKPNDGGVSYTAAQDTAIGWFWNLSHKSIKGFWTLGGYES